MSGPVFTMPPPVFRPTLGISAWDLMPASTHSQPGPGQVTAVTPGSHGPGQSFISEIPVTYNAIALGDSDQAHSYNKYLEAADMIFRVMPPAERYEQLELRTERVRLMNLYCLNKWLNEKCGEAVQAANALPAGAYNNVFDKPEIALDALLKSGNDLDKENRSKLRFLTANGIAKAIRKLGPGAGQANLMRQQDIREGSYSAANNTTGIAIGARGPFQVRNVWGERATHGKFLWLQIRRVDKGERSTTGNIKRAGSFQVVPYVSEDRDMRIAPKDLRYQSYTGDWERCINLLVGQVVDIGRRTVRDQLMLKQAAGLTDDRNLDTSYHQTQGLELIMVAVAPQWHGMFLTFA